MKPALLCCVCATAFAVPPEKPKIAGPSEEPKSSLQVIRKPAGMSGSVWAAEPKLANPVAFSIDTRGRVFVCETFRQKRGVEDNRSHRNWLMADLAAQSVEDRIAMFRKYLKDKGESYTKADDRIRLLRDTTGDGKADKATVFADGFNEMADGTGAGVLVEGNTAWYTNIPHLWKLTDGNGDGKADSREKLASGFGVRVAFRGHDMHGLIVGPDGKLYFSIGDRGYNVVNKEGKRLKRPDTGAVFRCNRDGSGLEVFCYGLRNPQELAFDDFGNLFTGDNNSDSGDKARWMYLVEGSDTGWRMYYQYLNDRGPWNREKLWHPQHKGQAAYIVPPVANLGDGPSGLVCYPGVGLSKRYDNHFFLADFRGTPNKSGIRSFAVKPKGAFFELTDSHQFLWQVLATDVDFGYDGGIYVSDWVNGWDGLGKGRIYRFADARYEKEAAASGRILKDGLTGREETAVVSLMSHKDRRVRLAAQFELVRRKSSAALKNIAAKSPNRLARLHGIWGLGMIGTRDTIAAAANLLSNDDDEVVAQCLRVIGDCGFTHLFSNRLVAATKHDSPRVQAFACFALGKIGTVRGTAKTTTALLEVLERNADADPVIRHAAVMGLAGSATPQKLFAQREHSHASARLGIVLALRRHRAAALSHFLGDSNPQVVLSAARAIHDERIEASMADLAKMAELPITSSPLLRRVLNANFRLGKRENAIAVARIAANNKTPLPLRLEAVAELKSWANPPPLDRVLGDYYPIIKPKTSRDASFLADVIRPHIGRFVTAPGKMRGEAIKLAAKFGIRDVVPTLRALLSDANVPARDRAAAVEGLNVLGDPQLKLAALLDDRGMEVRITARRLLAKKDAKTAIRSASLVIADGNSPATERQEAFVLLGSLKNAAADAVLIDALRDVTKSGKINETTLDLIEAVSAKRDRTLQSLLKDFRKLPAKGGLNAIQQSLLNGGNAEKGKQVFLYKTDASCLRCHRVDGQGGKVGPDLSGIAIEKDRKYLLESMIDPNKAIAKGFDSIMVRTDRGLTFSGVVKEDTKDRVVLVTAEGKRLVLDADEITARRKAKSAMPEDIIKKLTNRELRDLVEFLSQRKTKKK